MACSRWARPSASTRDLTRSYHVFQAKGSQYTGPDSRKTAKTANPRDVPVPNIRFIAPTPDVSASASSPAPVPAPAIRMTPAAAEDGRRGLERYRAARWAELGRGLEVCVEEPELLGQEEGTGKTVVELDARADGREGEGEGDKVRSFVSRGKSPVPSPTLDVHTSRVQALAQQYDARRQDAPMQQMQTYSECEGAWDVTSRAAASVRGYCIDTRVWRVSTHASGCEPPSSMSGYVPPPSSSPSYRRTPHPEALQLAWYLQRAGPDADAAGRVPPQRQRGVLNRPTHAQAQVSTSTEGAVPAQYAHLPHATPPLSSNSGADNHCCATVETVDTQYAGCSGAFAWDAVEAGLELEPELALPFQRTKEGTRMPGSITQWQVELYASIQPATILSNPLRTPPLFLPPSTTCSCHPTPHNFPLVTLSRRLLYSPSISFHSWRGALATLCTIYTHYRHGFSYSNRSCILLLALPHSTRVTFHTPKTPILENFVTCVANRVLTVVHHTYREQPRMWHYSRDKESSRASYFDLDLFDRSVLRGGEGPNLDQAHTREGISSVRNPGLWWSTLFKAHNLNHLQTIASFSSLLHNDLRNITTGKLLARIIKSFSYFDLLRARMVCKLWNAVIKEDPEIAQLLYKKPCRFIIDYSEFSDLDECEQSGDPVVIHPALQIMSYCMGEDIDTAAIYHPNDLHLFPVINLDIAHDFATRPTVTQVFIRPKENFGGRTGFRGPFCAKVTNARGVTVLNVLQAIVTECLVIDSPVLRLHYPAGAEEGVVTDDMVGEALQAVILPDGRRIGEWLNKADYLEGFRGYEGLEATRKGLRVNALVRLHLQPVKGEFLGPKRAAER
ncbi:hypothetical protein B0H17DRAFT_1139971 [Mycena rosella]|uniref:F-box domain-containing protein n=1 Tax=Mycena rosella TaxID=1033263 RepID=A0AAD7GAK3_MYCRO|nr:hypothetical protein B0H17DRAFT_1139971 [Mycena rosella]